MLILLIHNKLKALRFIIHPPASKKKLFQLIREHYFAPQWHNFGSTAEAGGFGAGAAAPAVNMLEEALPIRCYVIHTRAPRMPYGGP